MNGDEDMNVATDERFLRSLGIVTPEQLGRMGRMKLAVAGLGMGGSIFLDLVRMGFGRFHVADPDVYERTNVNRQRAARESTLGVRKDEALIAEARDIHPSVEIRAFPEGVTPENAGDFLDGVDWLVDVVDIWAMDAKLAMLREARRRRIPVVTAPTLGFGCSVVVLLPDGPSLEELAGVEPGMDRFVALERFARALYPRLPDYLRDQAERAAAGQGHIPFVVPGVEIAAALVTTEIARHVLGLGGGVVAPQGIYFDPVALKLETFDARASARPSHLAPRPGGTS